MTKDDVENWLSDAHVDYCEPGLNKQARKEIRALIEGQSIPDNIAQAIGASKVVDLRPKVSREFVEKWTRNLADYRAEELVPWAAHKQFIKAMLREAGVEVEE